MTESGFLRSAGRALVAGGIMTIIVNAVITPFLPGHVTFAETAASTPFLWRQSAAALAAVLLLFGSVGVYLAHDGKRGPFAAIAFALAFVGSALLLATEWTQMFDIRDFAMRAPDVMEKLDAAKGVSWPDVGAIIAFGTFVAGWIALCASTIRSTALARGAAVTVIVGFFATPLLQSALPSPWGPALGNTLLGSGWIWLGLSMTSKEQT